MDIGPGRAYWITEILRMIAEVLLGCRSARTLPSLDIAAARSSSATDLLWIQHANGMQPPEIPLPMGN